MQRLLQYLAPEAQDRLLDDITALSAADSTIAADYDAGTQDADNRDVSAITQTWRQRGFSLDMPSLVFTGERNDVGEYLSVRGWRMTSAPVTELVSRYGLETTRVMGPLANTVYATGNLAGA